MKILTHPDNANALRAVLPKAVQALKGIDWLGCHEVIENPMMDRDRPSGKYILPDGKVVPREQVSVRFRYYEYGPGDIATLLYMGLIREHREMLFYTMNDEWRFRFPEMWPVMKSPGFVMSSTV